MTHLKTLSLLLAAGLLVAGCGKDDSDDTSDTDVEASEFELLTAYMAENDMDLTDVVTDGWLTSAQSAFDAGLTNYFIVDLRSADDYATGHIDGAHSVALADIVTYVDTNNTDSLPVLVVCYTGQVAGHGSTALQLAGYEATVLKWGMSGWATGAYDKWSAGTGNAAIDTPTGWSTDAAPAAESYDAFPEIATGEADGAAILAAQVSSELSEFHGVGAADVLANPTNYQVVNFWGIDDYDTYGHVAGAFQVAPGELTLDTLDQLDPDATLVVYCWTGQTSSKVTAWLRVLGYDALSLKFGANSLIYDSLVDHGAHFWDATAIADMPVVTE